MYGLCVLNIFGSLLCFVATILGCTTVARETSRNQVAVFNPLSPQSDEHLLSPNTINTSLRVKVMRINKMIS